MIDCTLLRKKILQNKTWFNYKAKFLWYKINMDDFGLDGLVEVKWYIQWILVIFRKLPAQYLKWNLILNDVPGVQVIENDKKPT